MRSAAVRGGFNPSTSALLPSPPPMLPTPVNRKLFGGTNELLQNAGKGVRAADAYIEATADWTPQTKGKKALIPGQKVMLRPDLTEKEMKTYAWLDNIDVLNGAVIVVDTDERNVVVMRTDNVKTRILKRHLTAWFPVQKAS